MSVCGGIRFVVAKKFAKVRAVLLGGDVVAHQAFFGGAQHLFGSIMSILDPGHEPTERDMRRMDLIAHELEAFIHEFMQRNGITDPDIGPDEKPVQ